MTAARPTFTATQFLEHPDLGGMYQMFDLTPCEIGHCRLAASAHVNRDHWRGWYPILRAADAEPEACWSPEEVAQFRAWTGRSKIPAKRPRVVVVVSSRQVGKSTVVGLESMKEISNHDAAAGRIRQIMDVGQRLESSQDALGAIQRDLAYAIPALADMVIQDTETDLGFSNRLVVKSLPTSPRAIRSGMAHFIALDEPEFWISANPGDPTFDEILQGAALPATLNTGGQIWVTSTPFLEGSPLYNLREKFWGVDDAEILVFHVQDPRMLNPTLDPADLDLLRSLNPDKAASEIDAEFRKAIAGWVPGAVVDALVVKTPDGMVPPLSLVEVRGFLDISKMVHDSSVLVIAGLDHQGMVHILQILEERAGGLPSYEFVKTRWLPALQLWGCDRIPVVGDKETIGPLQHVFQGYGLPMPLMAGVKEPTLNREKRFDPDPKTQNRMDTNDAFARSLPAMYGKGVRIYWDDEPASPTGRLIRQLKGLQRKLLPGGTVQVGGRGSSLDDIAAAFAFAVGTLSRGIVVPAFNGVGKSGIIAALGYPPILIGKPQFGIAGRVSTQNSLARLRPQKRDTFHYNDGGR